ncbi:PBECR4 domain-containing protein [Lactobacillus sp. ESL0677]|uniref:PBECR4 domain-containing protein n=1 Tax=Lactobacillus sp. ESL0677 TaxID=2983208 RepID=UPI0023F9339E|nr:PBECR4 domain-containing protein [Lactobacillus sp. ESL0677]WEV37113.1 PBECR4 domain-containing protein [Lactobacillus sp. ESL0677]
MNQKRLDDDYKYHRITPSELKSFKKYLPKIRQAYLQIKSQFIGKTKEYIYVVNNREIRSLVVTFKNSHFMHLCGVKYYHGAKGFIKDLRSNHLKLENLYVKEDGTTFQKLQVIDKVGLLDSLETKISIGNKLVKIHYDNLVRTKADIVGIAIDTDANGDHFPLSLLNLSVSDTHTLTTFDVVAIIEENKITHLKSCLCKQKNCSQKINDYIDKRLHTN